MLPDGFEAPSINFSQGVQLMRETENAFIEKLRQWCVDRAKDSGQQHIGEVIHFPVADGRACYMVAALSPLQLIHLPIGDAWQFQYDFRLTKKDVVEKIKNQKALEAFVPKRF